MLYKLRTKFIHTPHSKYELLGVIISQNNTLYCIFTTEDMEHRNAHDNPGTRAINHMQALWFNSSLPVFHNICESALNNEFSQ